MATITSMSQKKYDKKDNIFALLKLIGAIIVIASHSCRYLGVPKPIWLSFLTAGSVGIIIFF